MLTKSTNLAEDYMSIDLENILYVTILLFKLVCYEYDLQICINKKRI